MKRNVVLIGMAGTGKTTVGQALAARLGWDFVDTDHMVEKEQAETIANIFSKRGEPAFRELESDAIVRALSGSHCIVATGGGAVLAEANREAMKSGGFVVALTAPVETIVARNQGDTSRPLFQGNMEERVRTLAEQRKHAYDFADLKIDTTAGTPEQLADSIIKRMEGEL